MPKDDFQMSRGWIVLRAVMGLLLVAFLGSFMIQSEYEINTSWTASLLAITILSLCFFLSRIVGLFNELKKSNKAKQKNLLILQATLLFVLNFFNPVLGGIWSCMLLARVHNFYSHRVVVVIVLIMMVLFTSSYAFYYLHEIGLSLVIILALLMNITFIFIAYKTHQKVEERLRYEESVSLNHELLAAQEILAQSSKHDERLRISRDLHDVLGHQVTTLILYLETATHIAEGEVLEKVEQSHALSKLLLSDLRNAVSELRDDSLLGFQQALTKLTANIPNLKVSFSVEPDLVIYNVDLSKVLLRCVQEALTNTLRHSNATESNS